MQRNAGHGAKYYETVELILVASLMFPYVLDRKHSINDYLFATEHNKTLFTQILFTELKMSHCSVSWALVSEYYTIQTGFPRKLPAFRKLHGSLMQIPSYKHLPPSIYFEVYPQVYRALNAYNPFSCTKLVQLLHSI